MSSIHPMMKKNLDTWYDSMSDVRSLADQLLNPLKNVRAKERTLVRGSGTKEDPWVIEEYSLMPVKTIRHAWHDGKDYHDVEVKEEE